MNIMKVYFFYIFLWFWRPLNLKDDKGLSSIRPSLEQNHRQHWELLRDGVECVNRLSQTYTILSRTDLMFSIIFFLSLLWNNLPSFVIPDLPNWGVGSLRRIHPSTVVVATTALPTARWPARAAATCSSLQPTHSSGWVVAHQAHQKFATKLHWSLGGPWWTGYDWVVVVKIWLVWVELGVFQVWQWRNWPNTTSPKMPG